MARAQEATAKASSNAIKLDKMKGSRVHTKKRNGNQNRNTMNNMEGKTREARQGERNMRLNSRKTNDDSAHTNRQQWNRSATTSFVKDSIGTAAVTQPQFKKMQSNSKGNSKVEDDLLDVFNSSMEQKSISFNKNSKSKARFQKKSHILTASKRRKVPQQQLLQRAIKRPVSAEYILEEPTPLSILEYTPQVFPTKESKLINFSLDSLRKSNYPIYRSPNLGILKVHDFTLNTPNFGKYMPGSSLILAKEPQLQNLLLQGNSKDFHKLFRGEYQLLEPYGRTDFEKLTKSKEAVSKLLHNSQIVRLSLQSVVMESEDKKMVYDVCSGIKPISELQQ